MALAVIARLKDGMTVRQANPFVDGNLNRGQVATLTLETAGSAVRGSATVQGSYTGSFSGYFATSTGNSLLPRATDMVIGNFASDATITIPDITLGGVASTDAVTGHCMANRPYQLFARKADYSDYTYRYGTTNGSGNFTVDLSADINVANGDPLQMICMYGNGDRILRDGGVGT